MIYYAVHKGHKTGIFMLWNEAKAAVDGYSGAIYKKFKNIDDAEYFVKTGEIRQPLDKIFASSSIKVKTKPINVASKTDASVSAPVHNIYGEYYSHPHYQFDSNVQNVYTDGSAIGNGLRHSVGGYGVFFPKTKYISEYIVSEPINGKVTNNIGELHALIKSLEHILLVDSEMADDIEVSWVIHYDSEYAVGVVTGSKHSSANMDLVRRGKKLLKMCKEQYIDIRFNHVYAHTGANDLYSIGNEIADRLANERGK